MKKSVLKFNSKALKAEISAKLIDLQTQNFVEYAKDKVRLIGDAIQLYNSEHNMDRTGNLLNSLCWGVAYSGRLIDSGFYRDARTKFYRTRRNEMTNQSYLHEFSDEYREVFEVDGRWLAEGFIKTQGRASAKGWWRVWFAILAPYWGYWEKGFTMKSNFGNSSRRMQFSVMAEFYDKLGQDLKPSKVKIDVHVPEYSQTYLKQHKHDYEHDPRYKNKYRK